MGGEEEEEEEKEEEERSKVAVKGEVITHSTFHLVPRRSFKGGLPNGFSLLVQETFAIVQLLEKKTTVAKFLWLSNTKIQISTSAIVKKSLLRQTSSC